MRLIDADALDNALTELRFNADGELAHWGDRKDWCLHGSEVEKLIADAPTVDAEPVRHGHWVKSEDADDGYCSVCECDMPMYREDWEWKYSETPYCPNCGAKMDEVEDG